MYKFLVGVYIFLIKMSMNLIITKSKHQSNTSAKNKIKNEFQWNKKLRFSDKKKGSDQIVVTTMKEYKTRNKFRITQNLTAKFLAAYYYNRK